jgi:hypothetical protein
VTVPAAPAAVTVPAVPAAVTVPAASRGTCTGGRTRRGILPPGRSHRPPHGRRPPHRSARCTARHEQRCLDTQHQSRRPRPPIPPAAQPRPAPPPQFHRRPSAIPRRRAAAARVRLRWC